MRLLQLFDNIGNCKFCHRIRFQSLGTTLLLDAHSQNEKFNLKQAWSKSGEIFEREGCLYLLYLWLNGAGWASIGEKIVLKLHVALLLRSWDLVDVVDVITLLRRDRAEQLNTQNKSFIFSIHAWKMLSTPQLDSAVVSRKKKQRIFSVSNHISFGKNSSSQ